MRPEIIIQRYRFRWRYWVAHNWFRLMAYFGRGALGSRCPYCFGTLKRRLP